MCSHHLKNKNLRFTCTSFSSFNLCKFRIGKHMHFIYLHRILRILINQFYFRNKIKELISCNRHGINWKSPVLYSAAIIQSVCLVYKTNILMYPHGKAVDLLKGNTIAVLKKNEKLYFKAWATDLCLSSKYCEIHLMLIFTLQRRSPSGKKNKPIAFLWFQSDSFEYFSFLRP